MGNWSEGVERIVRFRGWEQKWMGGGGWESRKGTRVAGGEKEGVGFWGMEYGSNDVGRARELDG